MFLKVVGPGCKMGCGFYILGVRGENAAQFQHRYVYIIPLFALLHPACNVYGGTLTVLNLFLTLGCHACKCLCKSMGWILRKQQTWVKMLEGVDWVVVKQSAERAREAVMEAAGFIGARTTSPPPPPPSLSDDGDGDT